MIDSLTKDLINRIGKEMNKKENLKNINQKFLDPIIEKFKNTMSPYLNILIGMYSVVLILIIILLILVIRNTN